MPFQANGVSPKLDPYMHDFGVGVVLTGSGAPRGVAVL